MTEEVLEQTTGCRMHPSLESVTHQINLQFAPPSVIDILDRSGVCQACSARGDRFGNVSSRPGLMSLPRNGIADTRGLGASESIPSNRSRAQIVSPPHCFRYSFRIRIRLPAGKRQCRQMDSTTDSKRLSETWFYHSLRWMRIFQFFNT